MPFIIFVGYLYKALTHTVFFPRQKKIAGNTLCSYIIAFSITVNLSKTVHAFSLYWTGCHISVLAWQDTFKYRPPELRCKQDLINHSAIYIIGMQKLLISLFLVCMRIDNYVICIHLTNHTRRTSRHTYIHRTYIPHYNAPKIAPYYTPVL